MNKRVFVLFSFFLAVMLFAVGNCLAADEFQQGIRTEKSYINESIGIRIDLDENYVMATDEDLQTMMGLGAEVLEVDKKLLDIAKITTIYDMMAANPADGSSVMVMAEKVMLSSMTMDQYMSALLSQFKELGADAEIDEPIEFCGHNWQTIFYEINTSGVNAMAVSYLDRIGDRVVMIQFSGTSEESLLNAVDLVSCTSID